MNKRVLVSLIATICFVATSVVAIGAPDEIKDYTGPFTTQVLYSMCSQNDAISKAKCTLYIQGLLYGLNVQRSMQERGMPVCLPDMTEETARIRILQFINGVTGGHPSNNKDGGDWMAFMGVYTAGNLCKNDAVSTRPHS
jgi:hypothetical protein